MKNKIYKTNHQDPKYLKGSEINVPTTYLNPLTTCIPLLFFLYEMNRLTHIIDNYIHEQLDI